jgi:hypothetical protein
MKKMIALFLLIFLAGCGGARTAPAVVREVPKPSPESKLIATVNPNATCQFVEALYLWTLPSLMVGEIQVAVEKAGGNAYKITNTQVKKAPWRGFSDGVDVNFEAYRCKP